MAQQQQQELERLETEAIAIWNFLVNSASTPAQLERLYLKVLVYLVAYFVNKAAAIAATAKPGIIGGSATAYRNRVLAISSDIADAGITNPSANNVTINLLAETGAPSVTLLSLVQTTMQADDNKTMCDVISVQPATAQNYIIAVSIYLSPLANESLILDQVKIILKEYSGTKQKILGGSRPTGETNANIIRTDIIDIIRNLPEVGDVIVSDPATNLIIPPQNYANCTAVTVVLGGRMN